MNIILQTHAIMAFILALTAGGMFFHLLKVRQPVKGKKWLAGFYLGLLCWQLENVVRFSMPTGYIGSFNYKLVIIFILMPALSVMLISHAQYAYRFLVDMYERERKIVFRVSICVAIAETIFVVQNEIYDGGYTNMRLSAFLYSTIFTIWIIILCIRKGLYLRSIGDRAAQAHFIYAAINASYVCGTITSVFFGIYSIAGYWTYFLFIWFGSLASIVLYIVFAAVPASFQTKITGFTYVLAATLLTIITLSLYPPNNTAVMAEQLERHKGLLRLLFLIILIAMLIVTLMPFMLKISITRPLQRLLEGVQNVNQGKLETQVPVGLKDEIGLLTQNFNRMTQSLKKSKDDLTDYAQTLEKKVSKRTAQLQQSLNELRSTQAQLIQSEKMASLGELTAGIAHEIQNPLNFVNNFSDLNTELIKEMKLELEVGNKEESIAISNIVANNEQKINHHGKRAEAIVKGMLQHSKTSGQKELTDINALAHNYLRLTYHDLRAKDQSFNATMQTDFDQNIEKINIIPQDIGKVLLNLFTNAFYSVTEKRKQQGDAFEPNVSISTKKLDDKIEIRVIDNGNGIPENVLDKIFQPFFTTKPAGQGTGLGLSLSYDIITKGHGGHIKVKTKEGEFTEFIIQLPGNSN